MILSFVLPVPLSRQQNPEDKSLSYGCKRNFVVREASDEPPAQTV